MELSEVVEYVVNLSEAEARDRVRRRNRESRWRRLNLRLAVVGGVLLFLLSVYNAVHGALLP